MNYALIRQLVDYAEAYEQQKTAPSSSEVLDSDVVRFVAWLNQQLVVEYAPVIDATTEEVSGGDSPDTMIGILVTFLYRYARALTKRALIDTPLVSFDDFTYLATLLGHPGLTKMELIQRNIHEKTTGMEIIRRLLSNGLISQTGDPTDKRSKCLTVSDEGQRLLEKIWPAMGQTAALIGGPISIAEKMQLVSLMDKLHQFHNPIFLAGKDESINELMSLLKK